VAERGETWAVDPEMREALDRFGADRRGEIRTAVVEMRRHFEVVDESLRGDIRGVAELVALSNEGSKRRDDEQAGRPDGLKGRVLRLEVPVSGLEDDRKPRRPRRRR
jgi:hypothetical protein